MHAPNRVVRLSNIPNTGGLLFVSSKTRILSDRRLPEHPTTVIFLSVQRILPGLQHRLPTLASPRCSSVKIFGQALGRNREVQAKKGNTGSKAASWRLDSNPGKGSNSGEGDARLLELGYHPVISIRIHKEGKKAFRVLLEYPASSVKSRNEGIKYVNEGDERMNARICEINRVREKDERGKKARKTAREATKLFTD
jgi:hypothetical protein